MLLHFIILVSCFGFGFSHESHSHNDSPVQAAQEIRKKWGTNDIIRDIAHIKEDVKKVMKLQEVGELSAYEALFYFFRMHDFDDNGRLDGHELMAAMRHTMEHGIMGHEATDTDLAPIVDSFFNLDDDNDGFLTYIELRKNVDAVANT